MCESNHSEAEIRHCLIAAATARNPQGEEVEFATRCADADEIFCEALSTASLDPDRARAAANNLADALSDYGAALISGEATDSLGLDDFFAHLMVTPFTRAIVHWSEIGLGEDQLIRLIDLVREHRSFVLESDQSTPVRALCDVPAGELASPEEIAASTEVYRAILLRTVETVDAVYGMLSDDQKTKLREVYHRETGHG